LQKKEEEEEEKIRGNITKWISW